MKQHIIKPCKAAYIEVRCISCQYLTEDATKTLVNSCILFRLEYSNSLLAGYPQTVSRPLQQVQNSAAKLILKSQSRTCQTSSQATALAPHRTENYKMACLCYQIITGTALQYLAELVQIYVPSRSLHSSSDDRTFCIPFLQRVRHQFTYFFKRKQHGGRAFCFSAVQISSFCSLSQPFPPCL